MSVFRAFKATYFILIFLLALGGLYRLFELMDWMPDQNKLALFILMGGSILARMLEAISFLYKEK